MITKTDVTIYSNIFEEINAIKDDNNNPKFDIHSVEAFFGQLADIAAVDSKFLRLPVDEPMFDINADSRKIDVPSEFKSNGLSVQGDNLAETVFFKIARYFDYMDLSTCDISINWKMGTETGKTKNFILSTNIEPGYIVFGWPVDSTITKKNGSLSFAVEFSKVTKDNNGVEIKGYSFNTLAATINIKEGLIVNNAEIADLESNIKKILTNSQFGEDDAAVGDIVWNKGLGTTVDDSIVFGNDSQYLNLNTIVNDGVPTSARADLYASANVDSATEIIYMDDFGHDVSTYVKFERQQLVKVENEELEEDTDYYTATGEVISDLETYDGDKYKYVDRDLDSKTVYYISENNDGNPPYNRAKDEQLINSEIDLYVRYGKIEVLTAGNYIVKAQGQKFVPDKNTGKDKLVGRGAVSSSGSVTVPAAKNPTSVVITGPVDSELPDGYSKADDATNVVFVQPDEEGHFNVDLTATAAFDVEEDCGALRFDWDGVAAAGYEEAGVLQDTHSITSLGDHVVKVINYKNGGAVNADDAIISAAFTISELATPIQSAKLTYRKNIQGGVGNFIDVPVNGIDSTSSVSLKADAISFGEVINPVGNLSYEWYKVTLSENGREELSRELVSTNGETYNVVEQGNYKVIIKNNYNGSIYSYACGPVLVSY